MGFLSVGTLVLQATVEADRYHIFGEIQSSLGERKEVEAICEAKCFIYLF